MAHVKIRIQLNRCPDTDDMDIFLNIDDFMVLESNQVLDFPFPNADAITSATFCTPEHIRKSVVKNRNQLARYVSDSIHKYMLDALKANDTEMGYKKGKP